MNYKQKGKSVDETLSSSVLFYLYAKSETSTSNTLKAVFDDKTLDPNQSYRILENGNTYVLSSFHDGFSKLDMFLVKKQHTYHSPTSYCPSSY